MAQEFKIGRLRYTWRGGWTTATFYNRDAVASFDGKTYVCIVPHTSSEFYDDYTNVELSGQINPYWVLMLDGQSWVGEWEATQYYTISNIVLYAGTVYKCITNHTSTLTFDPTKWQVYVAVDSQWANVYTPNTFYYKGDVTKFGGIVYKCLIEHTSGLTFYPDATKWELIYKGIEFKGDWSYDSVQYKLNDIVKFGADLWACQRNHVSGSGFDSTMELGQSIHIHNTTITGDIDYVTFTVGETPISALYLTKYVGVDQIAWFGIQEGAAWTAGDNPGLMLVQHHFGPTTSGYTVGDNVLAPTSTILDANTSYTIRIQQTGGNLTEYIFSTNPNYTAVTPPSDYSGIPAIPTNYNYNDWVIWIPGAENANSWNPSILYQPGDVVMYGGYSYICKIVNNLNIVPPNSVDDSTAAWDLLTIGYKFLGEWSNGTSYQIGSVVTRAGTLYQSIQDNLNQDPTFSVETTTYTAIGSSGTTLKVADTTDIVPGMIISGNGFSKGQYVTSVADLNTLIISEAPYSSITNGSTLTFTGVNFDNWELIIAGTRWRNRWTSTTTYILGDLSVWINKTYRCIRTHVSSGVTRPDQDTTNTYWVIYLTHDRNNVLNQSGDLIVNSQGNNIALPIGQEGYLLKSISGVPTWTNFLQTPKVYYVTPDGTDTNGSGTTWDNPYGSIRYACTQILNGLENSEANLLIASNKSFIVEEAAQWQVFQITSSIPPFDTAPPLDLFKTRRDSSYLIDAVIYDLSRGGNSQVIAFTLAFFDKVARFKYSTDEVAAQIEYYVATIDRIIDLISFIASGTIISPLYQTLNGITSPITQTLGSALPLQTLTDIESFRTIIVTALTAGDTALIPRENQGLTATIQVKTGTYYEQLPIVIPANTALNGDELRGVVVYPKVTINTLVTRSFAGTNIFRCKTTAGMINNTPVQFDSINSVNGIDSVFGGVLRGATYYVIGSSVTETTFSVTDTFNSTTPVTLDNFTSQMYVYGGDALSDMFRCHNGTGIRNMTLSGLLGCLTPENIYSTRRPTGGAYVTLDTGNGQDDTRAWIYRKSPYIQNVTTFGKGCIGMKIDGSLHNGGNKSIVCNDFTQIVSDGIGIWCTGAGSLCEAVSVFSYYAYAGYFAEAGGRIRATNGNSSYGTYGVVAEGFDITETPISGLINNQYYEASATPFSSLGASAEILKIQYSHAGQNYYNAVTNLLKNSNNFTNTWTTDGNVTLVQSVVSPFGFSDAWAATGNTSGTDSSYIGQTISITPSGASYSNLGGTNITGGGTLATFNVIVASTGYQVTVNNGGSGYVTTNQIKLLGTQLGGLTPDNDLTITVTALSGTSVQDVTTSGSVPAGTTQQYTYSLYIKRGSSPGIDLVASYSGFSPASSLISYNFSINTITASSLTGGQVPTSFAATDVSGDTGWKRLSFTFFDVTGLNNTLELRIYPRTRLGNSGYTLIYGSQLEYGSSLGFYYETVNSRYTSNANFKVVGPGNGAIIVGDEIRASSIYKTRIIQDAAGYTGGLNYLLSTNNAQAGDESSLTIAASDVVGATPYLGMRLFVNTGLGAGQYGTISDYDPSTKIATVLKESFDQLEITSTETTTDTLSLALGLDATVLYTNQPIQFIPTHYEIDVIRISQDAIDVLLTTGGTTNTITVTSTSRLTLNMPVNFSGTTYGGVTANFTYYIVNIVNDLELQVSTEFGGAAAFLNNNSGPSMQLIFPDYSSYLYGDTADMQINLPIYFTGDVLSSIVPGTTYYINDIIDANNFTISEQLVTPTATNTTTITNAVTLDDTSNLVSLNPIIFTGTAFGGIVSGTKYYINHINNATTITLSSSVITTNATASVESSDLITVTSTLGFIIGNPVTFTGATFGGIVNDQVYYILYVNNLTSFSISNSSTFISVTATATNISGRVTVNSTTNLTPLNPIKFYGTDFGNITAGTGYFIGRIHNATEVSLSSQILLRTATETAATSNLITVDSTVGFSPGSPVVFGGNTFGGIVSGTVYYIAAVNDETSFTIADFAGTNITLTAGTGEVSVRTGLSQTVLTATGSLTGTTRFGGSPVSLTTDTGNVIVRTTGLIVEQTTNAGSIIGTTTTVKSVFEADASENVTGTFTVPLIGGISQGTTYYVRTINAAAVPPTFTITATSGGSTNVNLTVDSGSMQVGEVGWDHINPGTPLTIIFDSTTNYSIEPRIYYSRPPFSISATNSVTAQLTGNEYISVTFGQDKFVALPTNGISLSSSLDGLTWNEQILPLNAGTGSWADIAYGANYWVIISRGGTGTGSRVLYSNSSLTTWKSSTLPSISNWNKVVYGNGRFVAIAPAAGAFSINNGYTWTSSTTAPSTTTGDIAYGAGVFVVLEAATGNIKYSSDGDTWTSAASLGAPAGAGSWTSITYGNGRFVAVQSTLTKAEYSFDGINWYESLYDVAGTNMAYGNGVFVLVGYAPSTSYIYTSEDGLTWNTITGLTGVGALTFGIVNGIGRFVSAAELSSSWAISAGSRTKARPTVVDGSLIEINEWDPGAGYTGAVPTVVIADTNATVKASVTPLRASGVLAGPTFVNRGAGYNTLTTTISITGDGFADNFQTGPSLVISGLDRLPSPGDNLAIDGDGIIYKITAAAILDGTLPPNILGRIDVSPEILTGNSPAHITPVAIRTKYSQARLTNHDYLNIGYGNFEESNYPRLPTNTVMAPQNETIESNYGRVFYSSTDQDGNFRVGELFAVEQSTGIVTLSASQFGLEGLNELQIGGVSIGGSSVIITQFSTDQTFVANSNNIVPTQKAIKAYLAARLTQGGSNTFTGQLIAGTVLVGGADRIQSTVPEGNQGSRVRIPVVANVAGFENGGWDGDGMAISYFFKTLISDRGVPNGQ